VHVVSHAQIEVSAFIAPEKSPLTSGSAAVFEAEGLVYLGLHTM
jgi:hypothetical protein